MPKIHFICANICTWANFFHCFAQFHPKVACFLFTSPSLSITHLIYLLWPLLLCVLARLCLAYLIIWPVGCDTVIHVSSLMLLRSLGSFSVSLFLYLSVYLSVSQCFWLPRIWLFSCKFRFGGDNQISLGPHEDK